MCRPGASPNRPSPGACSAYTCAESHAGEREAGRAGRLASRARGRIVAFAGAMLILGTIGALIEAVVVGAVVAFIARVRPALLGLPALSAPIPA